MNFTQTVFELIDMRSFSNLWYWIALAVMWSTASHYVLGVPYDMVVRASRKGRGDGGDLEALVAIRVRRLLHIARSSGLWLVGLGALGLAVLATLGFWYGVEFAQAVFLLAMPMSIVWLMSVTTARRIERSGLAGRDLRRCLRRLRFWIQVLGVVSIFVTSLWGMYQNLSIGPLG
ncbi:hypothetical protein LX81_01134 [Palleronia aestuarii]|uniref:Component of SufBCD complex n=1 Tax=Palleronia aestuarii TaxID=568105 RepID=A0A2W7NF10_9RHOB|nr:component of SufBCD complex [Palleronia aestuarii]PZX18500.1 hypothetical protein LX81_01134 [Palleronia aestuarii]